MIERLVALLRSMNADPLPVELADILWLARQLQGCSVARIAVPHRLRLILMTPLG